MKNADYKLGAKT
jgi:hypothetical protein